MAWFAGVWLAASVPAMPLVEPDTGLSFDPAPVVEGRAFECLGTGLREVFVFRIYALAFCVEPKAREALDAYVRETFPSTRGRELASALRKDAGFYGRLAQAPGDRLVVLRVVRDFSREKMGEAFGSSLRHVLAPDRLDRLIAAIPADAKEGDVVRIHSHGSRLTIDMAGRRGLVDDDEIVLRLWDVWLSNRSVTPGLRRSLAERAAERVMGARPGF